MSTEEVRSYYEKKKRTRKIKRFFKILAIFAAFGIGIFIGIHAAKTKAEELEGVKKGAYAETESKKVKKGSDKTEESDVPDESGYDDDDDGNGTGNGRIIAIDPGHGFDDVGTDAGYIGGYEKDINLEIAYLLKDELEARGYEVWLTHDGKSFVNENKIMSKADKAGIDYKPENFSEDNVYSAYERTIYTNVVNRKKNFDFFISLHVNSVTDESVGGFQLDYCDGNSYSDTSAVYAQNLVDSLYAAFPYTNMKFKADPWDDAFIVTKYTEMPSVLLEMGYATNRTDAANLYDSSWRMQFVKAVADGIDS